MSNIFPFTISVQFRELEQIFIHISQDEYFIYAGYNSCLKKRNIRNACVGTLSSRRCRIESCRMMLQNRT